MNPTVFVVEKGCRYEGVGLVGVFATEEAALAKVQEIMDNDLANDQENYELFKDEEWYTPYELWDNPDIWSWERGVWEVMKIREVCLK